MEGPGRLTKLALVVCALLGGMPPLAGAPVAVKPSATEAPAPPLVEAFQKGPISLSAKVTRSLGKNEQSIVPLFQVPVLKFQDKLELSFAGEAFDQRVTNADWSVVVVFLPRTIAPTDQGVVDFTLKRKDERMVIPVISVPYDSIPMIFLIPDKNARKKVLKDLNDHLEAFRTLCAKIADIATERAAADKFIHDLDAIDKNLSPAQYNNALQGFLHAYGDEVSGDTQAFLSTSSSNLDKCSLITQEFRNTNVLVPGSAPALAVAPPVAVAPGATAASAYVSIIFDLAAIINNLWPGHQFQYLPAVARDFHGSSADLYYSSWIRTTGDLRGALMCCPGNWEDQPTPAFDFDLPAGESILNKQFLLKARPRENSRKPFALYGHDWKLLLTGPKGESLPPLPLTTSPGKESFVATPGPILDAMQKLGASRVKARIVGRWGFTSIEMGPQDFPSGCDPLWMPAPAETAAFQVGGECRISLPATWAGVVERVSFRPAAPGAAPLIAQLKNGKDGSRQAVFEPKGDAGPGTLEITAFGSGTPALTRPLTLVEATPVVTGIEAHRDDLSLVLRGQHLNGIQAVEIGDRRFLPTAQDDPEGSARVFQSVDQKPLEGSVGKQVLAVVVTRKGKLPTKGPIALLPPRPRIGQVQVTPAEAKPTGLPITAAIPIASTSEPSQVSLLTGKGYRFPSDPTFHVAIRNADEPSEIRTIPPSKIRLMGRNEKATFTFNPAELLGGRAAGVLELKVQDDKAGAGDWLALPATFLELPAIGAIQVESPGFRLTGQSLDQIEAVAASPAGPWEKASVTIEEGREVARLATPLTSDTCYLMLFGWNDLVLAVKVPPPPPVRRPAPAAAAPPLPVFPVVKPLHQLNVAPPPALPKKEEPPAADSQAASPVPKPPPLQNKP